MNKDAFYHIYLVDDDAFWAKIVTEQMTLMKESGLCDFISRLFITIVCTDSKKDLFCSVVSAIFPAHVRKKIEITWWNSPFSSDAEMFQCIDSERAITENVTHQQLWNHCNENEGLVLYFHAKGVTAASRYLRQDPGRFVAYEAWRKFLGWGAISSWKTATQLLEMDRVELAGPNYQRLPSPHYSGGFWWARSDCIARLPSPSTTDWWVELQKNTDDQWLRTAPLRFKDEMWVCSQPHRAARIGTNFGSTNLATTIVERHHYGEAHDNPAVSYSDNSV